MSIESVAWNQLYRQMNAPTEQRPLRLVTARRILAFAQSHHRRLAAFLVFSIASAALAVATPVLAGRVVDAIVGGGAARTVITLAAIIAVVAVLDAGLGLVIRWLSARIGEGLIFDLRTAVFDHVQKMPVAFFTLTRTGALVSRLNNDVIGAQRAFSSTLSGVVTNVVTLLLTLIVMLRLSWQITLLALVLLPVFILPARRMGERLAGIQREASELNAAMSTQMTERFSAPGATLVKLFGRPRQESTEFAVRAGRVRDIGVRTAMLQTMFVTALTLVSALALALVYGLGGYLALRGKLEPGAVVALSLLLTRLYSPLTALASARVDIMAAMVSFERVFEVLDLKPLIEDAPDARPVPDGPVSVELDRVSFGYPSADKVSLASLEDVATLDTRGGEEVLHEVSLRAEPGQMVALVGSSGAGKSTIAQLVSRLYDIDSGAVRLGGADVRELTGRSIQDTVGLVTQDGIDWAEKIAHLQQDDAMGAAGATRIAERLIGLLRADGERPTIVDIGAGTGGQSAAFARELAGRGGGRLVIADAVPELLEVARRAAADTLGGDERVTIETLLVDATSDDVVRTVPAADLVWASRMVHHLPDQQDGVDRLAKLVRPGGWLALSEGGLPTRYLPWDLGVGAPGLEDRLLAMRDERFGHMRAEIAEAVPMPYGWGTALTKAGLGEVTSFSVLIDHPAPASPAIRETITARLDSMREHVGDELGEQDRATLAALLDPAADTYIGTRDDVYMLGAVSVHLGRR
ncbi:ABC transporter transmembrane domain-containing protein [Nocardia crassostreae]|uniref:ABC transporter transmembrane domain-containing protein n=1 Tax=Nocardia crassostreae TaxID=53428 RepID=UPI000B328C1E|nr:ABC transporter transmembrane domain-containing protein [Nocardia crassostreae]